MTTVHQAYESLQGQARGAHPFPPADMSGELDIKHQADGSIVITHLPDGGKFSGDPAYGCDADMGAEKINAKAIGAKVKPVAVTATATLIGLAVAGPIGLLVGAGVGGAIDWYRHKKHPAAAAPAPAPSGPVAIDPGLANLKTIKLKPLAMASMTKAAPTIPKLKLIKMATAAKTATPASPAAATSPATVAAKSAADALYNYFQQYPFDRMLGDIFWKSNKTGVLVKAFQQAYNEDAATNQATGTLSVNGLYDSKTAGALTFFTHNPVDPDPSAG